MDRRYKRNVVSLAYCDECGSEITEFCDNHFQVICESCHKLLVTACIDEHGMAVRDNTSCEKVDITIIETRGENNE